MKINLHAGHNPDGKTACGAVGFIRESTEARRVKDEAVNQLRQLGHTVYDCTCENGTSQSDVLTKIVNACNEHEVDLDVSIHFNAGARDSTGNGMTTGTEVLIYNAAGRAKEAAERTCASVAAMGYKNRGVKENKSLYFLRKTKAPAMLIECCFVDDKDDVQLYNCQEMAKAIAYGITGTEIIPSKNEKNDVEDTDSEAETTIGNIKEMYRVQVGAYVVKENALNMQKNLKAVGFDAVIVRA